MEGNGVNSVEGGGVTVVRSESPTDYHIAPRSDAAAQIPGSTKPPAAQAGFPAPVKKKRGRPRKYAADGSATKALSPKPISSSAPTPPVIDFSGEKQHFHVEKQPKPRPATGAVTKPHKPKFEVENLGDWVSSSVGANFTPHIITVNTGEDVMMKVISFSQQGPRAICILSANGVVSSATLRQPDSSGGTLTYEGRFEILSLTGSFAPSESGGTKNRSGGVSISLASPDGRVVGGGVAGLLVAAAPVQIVVASFVAVNEQEQEQKPKKQRPGVSAAAVGVLMRSSGMQDQYGSNSKPAPSYFPGDNWSSRNNNNDHQG